MFNRINSSRQSVLDCCFRSRNFENRQFAHEQGDLSFSVSDVAMVGRATAAYAIPLLEIWIPEDIGMETCQIHPSRYWYAPLKRKITCVILIGVTAVAKECRNCVEPKRFFKISRRGFSFHASSMVTLVSCGFPTTHVELPANAITAHSRGKLE